MILSRRALSVLIAQQIHASAEPPPCMACNFWVVVRDATGQCAARLRGPPLASAGQQARGMRDRVALSQPPVHPAANSWSASLSGVQPAMRARLSGRSAGCRWVLCWQQAERSARHMLLSAKVGAITERACAATELSVATNWLVSDLLIGCGVLMQGMPAAGLV